MKIKQTIYIDSEGQILYRCDKCGFYMPKKILMEHDCKNSLNFIKDIENHFNK